MTEIVAIRLCMSLGIFNAIPENGAISAADLAKAVNATVSLVGTPAKPSHQASLTRNRTTLSHLG